MGLMLFIYLADCVEGLKIAFGAICFASLTLGLGLSFVFAMERQPSMRKNAKPFVIVGVVCLVLALIIPKQSTMYMMAGVYVGQEVLKSDALNSKLDKINALIDLKLNKMIDELKK